MRPTIIQEISTTVGLEEQKVVETVAQFALQLHRHALQYEGGNGDFIGEYLWCQVSPQAFFHLLGFLEYFAKRYSWEPGSASEYLRRLPFDWERFNEQMK